MNQFTPDWDSRLRNHKQNLASAVSRSVVLTENLKAFLALLDGGPILGDEVKPDTTNRAEIRSAGVEDPAGAEMRFPGADDPFGTKMRSPGADALAVTDAETVKA